VFYRAFDVIADGSDTTVACGPFAPQPLRRSISNPMAPLCEINPALLLKDQQTVCRPEKACERIAQRADC